MPTQALKRVLDVPVRWPRSIVVGTLALTVFFAAQIVDPWTGDFRLRIDPSVEGLLPSETAERDRFEHLKTTFGEREPIIVALGLGEVFENSQLLILQNVTLTLASLPGVANVVSLATLDVVRSDAGETVVEPFAAWIGETPQALAELREIILGNRVYAGNLISKDASTAAILVYLDEKDPRASGPNGVLHQLRGVVEENAPGVDVFLTGSPYVRAATAELLLSNFSWILPLALLAVIAVAIVVFRSVAGVMVSVSEVVIAVVWILGGVALLGRPLNLVTIIVPPLLLSIGFAYAVHVVSDYLSKVRKEDAPIQAEAIRAALREVALPVSLTGITTVAGFLSLTVSPFGAVREFGVIAVIGVIVAVLLTLFYAPALLGVFPQPRANPPQTPKRDGFAVIATRLADFALGYRTLVLILGGALFVLSLIGVTQIRVNTRIIDNLPADHPVRTDFYTIGERLGGGSAFQIVMQAHERNRFVDPEVLAQVDAFETWLEEQPEIGSSTSLLDHLKLIHRVFHDDDPAYETIPQRAALSKQLLLLGGSRDLVDYVDAQYTNINIHVRTRSVDSQSLRDLMDRIEGRLAQLPKELDSQITGSTVLLAGAVDDVAAGQIQSLSLAFGFIFLILAALFMSLRIGATALVPNALPVAVYFGLIGFGGLPLDTTTGLLACIVLGIAVDDTIHFLTRFNQEARERADELEGARYAMLGIVRPVTISTLALCAGLLVLTTSDLENQVRFGALGALTLAFAWVVDLTFTPALCSRLKIVSLWDALSYDLGSAPQETIPLFSGLSHLQARIVALATQIVKIPAGSALCREGDPGDDLWVVIDGELQASIERDGRRTVLESLKRGSVVGEIALFHDHLRTADVDAITDVRAMRLSGEILERFRSRYPRLGSKVFWNLSRILASRVVAATGRLTS